MGKSLYTTRQIRSTDMAGTDHPFPVPGKTKKIKEKSKKEPKEEGADLTIKNTK